MNLEKLILVVVFQAISLVDSEKCASENGIQCDCNIKNSEIKISNCVRPGGWSTWSKWSQCREGIRKRRRTCNNPQPIGTVCLGSKVEKQKCSQVPEFLFGSWTSWNPWSRCDCDRNLKLRTRHCQGSSCEGCGRETEDCRPEECPINKKWSSWTDWVDYGSEQFRYTAWCSSSNVKNVNVGWRRESRESTRYANWSEWQLHSGVAYRYRLLRNSSISIEHHLISRSTSSCLPLHFALPLLCFSLLLGFFLQFLIMCTLNKCRRSYRGEDYPPHLIRSPKDESFW